MAIQSQIYKAPSLPKMGKNSSPLNSSSQKIDSVVKGPDLKTSKMSFIKGLGISIITAESLKTVEKPVISTNTLKIVDKIVLKPKKSKGIDKPEIKDKNLISSKGIDKPEINGTNLISSELAETNSILVEIQKQLALDFAARIEERKDKLAIEKKKIRTKKLGEKEKFVEKGKDFGSGIKGFATKAIAPIKGIFDKIIEFLTLVGTGILVNSVWEWMQDPDNRDKVIAVFTFLKTYWKEIFFTILTLAVIKKIVSLLVFANRLKKLFNLFRGNKPGGGGGGGCGAVIGCGKVIVAAIITSGLALLAGAFLKNGLVAPPVPPGLVAPPTTGQPVLQPSPITADPIGQGLQDIENMPDGILGTLANIGNSREFQIGSLLAALTAAGVAVAVPEGISSFGGLAAIGPLLTKLKLAMSSAAIKGVAIGGVTLAVASPMTAMAKEKGIKVPPENEVAEQVVKYFGLSKDELLEIYKNKNTKIVERLAAEKTLTQQYNLKLDPPEFSRGGIIPGMPSMQDTIHALLAKGEFVINSMSTKMFKPFLYAMNNNAGRLFKQFVEGVNLMKKNNELSREVTTTQSDIVKKLNEQVGELVRREEEKKRKRLQNPNGGGGGGGVGGSTSVSAKNTGVATKSKPVPIKIQTYRRGIGGGGRTGGTGGDSSGSSKGPIELEVIPFKKPTIDLSAQQTPDETPTQVSEKSQSSITISSTDSSNPYIANSYVNYGIDV